MPTLVGMRTSLLYEEKLTSIGGTEKTTLIAGLGSGIGRPFQTRELVYLLILWSNSLTLRGWHLYNFPHRQNTIGIHNTTTFSWQLFITLQTSGRLSMKKDILNAQRNLGVPWRGLTLHLTVAAPKGSSSAKVTQHTQHARECAISPCSTPPLSR